MFIRGKKKKSGEKHPSTKRTKDSTRYNNKLRNDCLPEKNKRTYIHTQRACLRLFRVQHRPTNHYQSNLFHVGGLNKKTLLFTRHM